MQQARSPATERKLQLQKREWCELFTKHDLLLPFLFKSLCFCFSLPLRFPWLSQPAKVQLHSACSRHIILEEIYERKYWNCHSLQVFRFKTFEDFERRWRGILLSYLKGPAQLLGTEYCSPRSPGSAEFELPFPFVTGRQALPCCEAGCSGRSFIQSFIESKMQPFFFSSPKETTWKLPGTENG